MAIYINNIITKGLSGKFGRHGYFRQYNGRTVFCRLEHPYTGPLSAKQVANNDRFRKAHQFAQHIINNPGRKALYARRARNGRSAYNEAISDAMHAPEIREVAEHRHTILIRASDNFEVTKMLVQVYDDTGTLIEEGRYTTPGREVKWKYKLKAWTPVRVVVKVYDAAGNMAEQEVLVEAREQCVAEQSHFPSPHSYAAAEESDTTGAELRWEAG